MRLKEEAIAIVTGAAGFIGSHLVKRLLKQGLYVIGVDNFSDYYPRWMKELNIADILSYERFIFIETDLLSLNLRAVLRGEIGGIKGPRIYQNQRPSNCDHVDYVFHLAAQPGVRSSWGINFESYVRNNVLVTQRLLEAAKDVPLRKFVYASSSSVYGDAETFPTPENALPRPVSPYGVTKLAGEHLCFLYWCSYNVPAICLRYFTVYGPHQRPDMAFYRFIKAILKGQPIEVYGDGEQTRDYTYVSDVVDATIRSAGTDCSGEVFNIGGGSRVSVNEVILLLEQILGRKAQVKYVNRQHGDARHTSADISRATSVLGFQPQTSFIDGLAAEVEWLMKQMKHGLSSQ